MRLLSKGCHAIAIDWSRVAATSRLVRVISWIVHALLSLLTCLTKGGLLKSVSHLDKRCCERPRPLSGIRFQFLIGAPEVLRYESNNDSILHFLIAPLPCSGSREGAPIESDQQSSYTVNLKS